MSVRDNIKDNIVTTLQGITTGAGYSHTMAAVTKARYDWSDWGVNEEWPKACMYPGTEQSIPRIGYNIYDHRWTMPIRIFYKGDDAAEHIEQIVGDVRLAMLDGTTLTRGGYAWNTDYVGTDSTEDTFEEDARKASIILNFLIEYREYYPV